MIRSLLAHPVEHRLARGHRHAVDRQAQVLERAAAAAIERRFDIGCGIRRASGSVAARRRAKRRARVPSAKNPCPLKGNLQMKLGVHIGYWGMGLSSRGPARRSSRRPSGSATTRSGPRRPTGPTPPPCSAGSRARPRRSASAPGIFQMPARSAAMTAMTAATIDQLSDGRMLLGIGSSGPQVAEGWHGQRFAKQLQRTREYVAVVRMALARERVEFHGETLELPLPDGPGQGAEAHDLPRPGADPHLPRRDRPEEHGPRRRDRRRLDPHAVLPRARLRAAAAARGRRRALRANARGLRHRADRQACS